jgi:hypothetical protein
MPFGAKKRKPYFLLVLLRNAQVLDKLYCDFAEGPLWIQTKLMREMEGWVVNDGATKEFH